MATRREIISAHVPAYRRVTKAGKREVLECVVGVTAYHRKYAAWLLRNHGRRIRVGAGNVLVGDAGLDGRGVHGRRRKRRRRAVYNQEV